MPGYFLKAGQPRNTGLPLRIVWFSGLSLNSGIDEHNFEGMQVRVYSMAKTVADCFK